MRVVKILGIVFCALVVLVGGLMIAAFFLINPNDYKNEIATAVKKQTGRELVIQGDISLSVFPWLALELDQVSLGNAPGFSNPVFARIGKAKLRIKIMPLFKKEVEVGTVVLDGLQVNLERLKNGTTNWEDLAPAKKKKPAFHRSVPKAPTKKKNAGFALAALGVDGVRITDGAISWKDGQSGTRTTLDNLEMTASHIALQSPFALFFGFDLHHSAPAINARITLRGNAIIDPEAGTYAFSNAALKVTGTGRTLPGGKADLTFTSDIALDLPKQLLGLSNMTLTGYGLDLHGEIKGTTIFSVPEFKGRFNLAPCNPREVLQNMGQTAPETADPSVLKALKADLTVTASRRSAELTSLNLLLDQTRLQGIGSVKNFNSPAISFALNADVINLDRYLSLPKKNNTQTSASSREKTSTSASQSKKLAQATPIPLPIDQLRKLDLTGEMTLSKLIVNKLKVSDVVIHILAGKGRIILDPIAANLYQGKVKAATVLNVRDKIPDIEVTETLSAMQIGPLLKDMTGKESLTGTAQSTASLKTSGLMPDDLKANLHGKLAFSFTDGSIQGINIPKILRDAVIKAKGGTPNPNDINKTDFASITGTGTITKGVFHNRDLLMMAPLMRLNGKGQVNIPKEKINYLLTASVVSSIKGQKGEPLAELAGLSAPIRILGTIAQPKFKLDLASLLKEKGMQKLKEKAMKELFKGKKPGGIDPGKVLQNLFK